MTKKKLNNKQEGLLIKKYQKDYSAPELAKEFGTNKTNIYKLLRKKGIRIRTNSEANSISMKKYPRKVFIKQIKIPKNREEIEDEAEIIGIIMGDGHISRDGRYIRLRVRELDFCQNFKGLIERTYKTNTSLDNKYYYNCYAHSTILTRRLIKLTRYNKEIPGFILNGTKRIKARFLRGFFDAEGSVDIIENRRQIVLTQKNLPLLEQIKGLLKDLRIQCKVYDKKNDSDKLVISLLENLDKYYNSIGFSISYKQEKLKNAVIYLKEYKPHEKEKYWKVLRHCINTKNSIRGSAKKFKMNWETYRSWIYGMKMPCQIKKDIEYSSIPKDYKKLREYYHFLPSI